MRKPHSAAERSGVKKILLTADDQNAFKGDCSVLVGCVIPRFLPEFQYLMDTNIHHIPHPFSQEQKEKPEVISFLF